MDVGALKARVRSIVERSTALKDKYVGAKDIPIAYACIFAHNQEEYAELLEVAGKIGNVVKETSTGLIFRIEPLDTVSGILELLKIRLPDIKKQGLGYGDFTVPDYQTFKKKYLTINGFHLTKRQNYEFIGIYEDDVGAYFSDPPFDKVIGDISRS